jgi:Flp pilus assembly protein TadD
MTQSNARTLMTAAGVAAFSITLAACQSRDPVARMNTAVSNSEVAASASGSVLVNEAAAALAASNAQAAVSFAELAVRAEPNNAEARIVLGRAYLAAGRFVAASDAFGDVDAMAAATPSTRLRGALASLAAGKTAAAVDMLYALSDVGEFKVDVGLALALAGEAETAVRMLTDAIREGDASPRARQNLALAQALAGHWAAARMTASMDLSPDKIDARIAEWTALAGTRDSGWRMATVLGIAPAAEDRGRPVELAWSAPVAADVPEAALAMAAPEPSVADSPVTSAPAVDAQPATEVAVAPVEPAPAPVAIAKADVPEPAATDAAASPTALASVDSAAKPLVFDGLKPATTSPPAASAKAKTAKKPAIVAAKAQGPLAKPMLSAVKRDVRPLPKASAGAWVVQVGSYARPEFVAAGWQGLVEKANELTAYKPLKSTVEVDGNKYYRLSVGTFATPEDAKALCDSLKTSGHRCFARKGDGARAVANAAVKKA